MTKIISNSTWTLRARAASPPPLPFLLPTKHKHNEADDDDEATQLGDGAAVQDVDNKKCSCCDFNAGDEAQAGEHQVPLDVDSDAGVSGFKSPRRNPTSWGKQLDVALSGCLSVSLPVSSLSLSSVVVVVVALTVTV